MGRTPSPGDQSLELFGLLSRYLEGEATVAEIARSAGVSPRTIWRRLKAHQEKGLRGLNRATRKDKGNRRKISDKIKEVIEGLYLKCPKPTVIWIYEQLLEACERDAIRPPSYTVTREICRTLDERLKVLAHQGDDAYEQTYDLIVRREAERPNHMWQADHKELKVWAKDKAGKVGKVWLTAILDDYSRVVTGYFLGIGPANFMRIASALRQAIWVKDDKKWTVCGIPDIFYTDRGRDFKSTHMEQAAADLGIKLVLTRRKKPRGKGKIERLFRTADSRFTSRIKSSAEKPLDLEVVREAFHEWLMTDYHQRIHSEIKKAPLQKWSDGNILPKLPVSIEALDLMLQKVGKPRLMRPDGIRFNQNRYSDMSLSQSVGQEFSIRYDPRDLSSIWVYGEEGKLVCKATCAELTGRPMSAEEIFAERARVKRELKARVKSRHKAAEDFVGAEVIAHPRQSKSEQSQPPAVKLRRHFHERYQ